MNLLAKMLPPPGIGRPLALQSMVYAMGSGLFLAGSAAFFTQVVGLRATTVGVGLSVAAVVSMVLSVPLGSLADRIGSRRAWILAICAEAAMFCLYPFVHGFAAFLAVVCALSVVDGVSGAGRTMYTLEVIPAADRVLIQAFQRSALNVGFTAGAGAAGVVLWIDSRPAYLALPLGYALVLVVNAVFVARLPRTEPVARAGGRPRGFAVFADRSYISVSLVAAALLVNDTLCMVVMPLWLLAHTDAPKVLIAWSVVINTVLVVFLQVPASRGADDVPGAGRMLRRAGLALAAACLVLALSAYTSGVGTIAVVAGAAVLFTFAEMFESAGMWGVSSLLPPAELRGQYIGASRMTGQLQRIVAPAAFTALTVGWGNPLSWVLIAAGAVALGLAAVPVVAWADRSPRLGARVEPSLSEVG